MGKKNQHISLKPVTFFDELAEYGCLEEYLNTFFQDKMKSDIDFSNNMIAKLNHFPDINYNITDQEAMKTIHESLDFFLEYIKPWKQKTA